MKTVTPRRVGYMLKCSHHISCLYFLCAAKADERREDYRLTHYISERLQGHLNPPNPYACVMGLLPVEYSEKIIVPWKNNIWAIKSYNIYASWKYITLGWIFFAFAKYLNFTQN